MSQALLQRWIDGDEEVLESLYQIYYPRILNFAAALIGNPAEGEDLAQETFLRLHRARTQLQKEGISSGSALICTR